ncbi:guanine nucleotide-binding protein G(i) subunit alpha-1-like [Sycon ciliatum]|uniref:guanine nucleotide-binding protein G(i) subunit alpha-1-like n=1 Tax=Sycon ciliatum TaxID=27933 RepID=UPI0031F680CC
MGAAATTTFNVCTGPERRAADRRSHSIDKQLRQWWREDCRRIKLLFLGSCDSDEGDVVEQILKTHYASGSGADHVMFRNALHRNLVESMRCLVTHMNYYSIEYSNPQFKDKAWQEAFCEDLLNSATLHLGTLNMIEKVWMDEGVRQCFQRLLELNTSDINESTEYLLSNVRRYMAENFMATRDDIRHVRLHATNKPGIQCTGTRYRDVEFLLFDLRAAGMMIPRPQTSLKLVCQSEGAMTIVFCASLADYDRVRAGDESTNCLLESLDLFSQVCNGSGFRGYDHHDHSNIVLLLTNTESFREKISTTPLSICFPEYNGQDTTEEAIAYIEKKFNEVNRIGRQLFVHRTRTYDSSTMALLYSAATSSVIQNVMGAIFKDK